MSEASEGEELRWRRNPGVGGSLLLRPISRRRLHQLHAHLLSIQSDFTGLCCDGDIVINQRKEKRNSDSRPTPDGAVTDAYL